MVFIWDRTHYVCQYLLDIWPTSTNNVIRGPKGCRVNQQIWWCTCGKKTSIWLVISPIVSQTIYPYKYSNSNSHQPVPTVWAAEKITVRVCRNAINSNLFVTVLLQQTTSWTNPWSGAIPLQSSRINPNDLNLMPGFYPMIQNKRNEQCSIVFIRFLLDHYLYNHMIIPSRFQ